MKLPHIGSMSLLVHRATLFGVSLCAVCLCADAEEQTPQRELDRIVLGRSIAEWHERMKAIDPKGPEAAAHVEPLVVLMRMDSIPEFTRRQAALTLGRMGQPAAAAVPVLQELLARADSDSTRLWILKSLTLLGDTAGTASTDVAELVHDSGQTHLIRVAGIEALCRMGPAQPQVMQTLLEGLRGTLENRSQQSRQELQMATAEVLGILGPAAAPALPELVRATESDWDLLRLSAVTTLGKIGPQAELAIPALADVILFDEAPEVRDAAAVSLGAIGNASLSTLVQLAKSRDPEVRERALMGAAALGSGGVPVLTSLLKDEELRLRVLAADQLLGDSATATRAATVLLLNLAAAPPRLQRTAFAALRKHPAAWNTKSPEFQQLLNHDAPQVRQLANRLQRERPSKTPVEPGTTGS